MSKFDTHIPVKLANASTYGGDWAEALSDIYESEVALWEAIVKNLGIRYKELGLEGNYGYEEAVTAFELFHGFEKDDWYGFPLDDKDNALVQDFYQLWFDKMVTEGQTNLATNPYAQQVAKAYYDEAFNYMSELSKHSDMEEARLGTLIAQPIAKTTSKKSWIWLIAAGLGGALLLRGKVV